MSEAQEPPSPTLQAQAYVEYYKEQCAHGRHLETQRHAVAAMFLAAAGILLSVIGSLRFSIHSVPLAFAMIALGLFGHRFVALYAVKWDEAGERRTHYRLEAQGLLDLNELKEAEENSKGSLRKYWKSTFKVVTGLGILCFAISAAIAYARTRPCPDGSRGLDIRAQLAGCQIERASAG